MHTDKLKALARDLRRLTGRSLSLSTAQGIIARGHGYRDWHHAEQDRDLQAPHPENTRRIISQAVLDATQNLPPDNVLYALVPDELPPAKRVDDLFREIEIFDTKVDGCMSWIGHGETFEAMITSIANYLECKPGEVAVVRRRYIAQSGIKTRVDSFCSMSDADLGAIFSRVPGTVLTEKPYAEWNVPVGATVDGRTAIGLAQRYQILIRHDEVQRGHWHYGVSGLRTAKLAKAFSGHLGRH